MDILNLKMIPCVINAMLAALHAAVVLPDAMCALMVSISTRHLVVNHAIEIIAVYLKLPAMIAMLIANVSDAQEKYLIVLNALAI